MLGILYPLLAGILISLQTVFNARVSEKIGLWETTTIIHVIGLILVTVITLIWGQGSFGKLAEVNKLHLLGGVFGVFIVFSIAKGASLLGVSLSISVLLISQLVMAAIIDTFGLFGAKQITFDYTKPLGILIMIAGIIIFKIKG